MVEEATVGGNHIWSHFASDVDQSAGWLVEPLIAHRWPAYDVAFPAHARTLAAPYRSITSERFAAVLAGASRRQRFVSGRVMPRRPGRVELADGRVDRGRRGDRRPGAGGRQRPWIWAGRSSSVRPCTRRNRTACPGRW